MTEKICLICGSPFKVKQHRSGTAKFCSRACLGVSNIQKRQSSANWKHKVDLTGNKYGRLTVIRQGDHDRHGKIKWVCLCECSNETMVLGRELLAGGTKSCGCFMREENRRLHYKHGPWTTEFKIQKKVAEQKRGLQWGLTLEQFEELIKAACTYCGASPRPHKTKRHLVRNGIDRRDNAMGYTPDNCVSCCFNCNRMKGDLPLVDFLEHIRRIGCHYGGHTDGQSSGSKQEVLPFESHDR